MQLNVNLIYRGLWFVRQWVLILITNFSPKLIAYSDVFQEYKSLKINFKNFQLRFFNEDKMKNTEIAAHKCSKDSSFSLTVQYILS